VAAAEQTRRDQPADGADRIHVARLDGLQAGASQKLAQLRAAVTSLVADVAVDFTEERRVSRDDEKHVTAGNEARADPAKRPGVVGDVLEHVETYDRVEACACSLPVEPSGVSFDDSDVRIVGEATAQVRHELRVGLDRDDLGSVTRRESGGERSDSRAEVENVASDVGGSACEQPVVVVDSVRHPIERLFLSGWREKRRRHGRILERDYHRLVVGGVTDIRREVPTRRSVRLREWVWRHRGIVLVELLWLAFAANFNYGFVYGGDAQVPYTFLRRLFGADVHALGYQFGLAFFEAPFYAIGKGLDAAGVETIRTHPSDQAMIAFGAVLYVGATMSLVYAVLRGLGLRWAATAAGIALFGTSLFYYGVFSPAQTHVVDTLLSSALVLTTLAGFRRSWPVRLLVLAGVILGAAVSVRYFEAALGAGLFFALVLYRRFREAVILTAAAGVTFGLLAAVPLGLGVHLFQGGYQAGLLLRWSPASPFDMLFTLKRGLFLWTPVTALAVAGYVLLLRRDRAQRPFLVAVGLMAVLLVAVQAAVPFWDAGWSFSQRYFTALLPFFAIGIAGVFQVRPRLTAVASAAAVAWSLFLALTMVTLPYNEKTGGVDELVHLAGTQSPGSYAYGVWHISHLKLVVGRSPFASK